ncbi:MAG: heme A synthase [Betaproteobacteria bacterium]|nr:heme A synthase [Betaproteobacteria bacterium]
MINSEFDGRDGRRRGVVIWLLLCCALVAAIVVVGGATRLTRSGLSIVEWRPLTGVLPPLTAADWQVLFDQYRATPEYRLVNKGMSLDAFKSIFWWEYGHRLLGRLIGVFFFIPLIWFWVRGRLDRRLGLRLLGVFILGGLQGALGWYMVQSGLVDDPKVSHLRLAAHLGLALLIFWSMLWIALGLLFPSQPGTPATRYGVRSVAWMLPVLVFIMALSGALVAGIRAGYAYNTFPLMNGHWIPLELFSIEPWWRNFFYNMATVQFDHRLLAYLLIIVTGWLWWRVLASETSRRARYSVTGLALALVLQFGLGIATLLNQVPVLLGVLHQGGAVLVLTAAIVTAHTLRRD